MRQRKARNTAELLILLCLLYPPQCIWFKFESFSKTSFPQSSLEHSKIYLFYAHNPLIWTFTVSNLCQTCDFAEVMLPNLSDNYLINIGFSGGPRRIRTPDPLIRSQVLYPAELSVHTEGIKVCNALMQEQI